MGRLSLDHMPSVPMSSEHPPGPNLSAHVICCKRHIDIAVVGLLQSWVFIVSSTVFLSGSLGTCGPQKCSCISCFLSPVNAIARKHLYRRKNCGLQFQRGRPKWQGKQAARVGSWLVGFCHTRNQESKLEEGLTVSPQILPSQVSINPPNS